MRISSVPYCILQQRLQYSQPSTTGRWLLSKAPDPSHMWISHSVDCKQQPELTCRCSHLITHDVKARTSRRTMWMTVVGSFSCSSHWKYLRKTDKIVGLSLQSLSLSFGLSDLSGVRALSGWKVLVQSGSDNHQLVQHPNYSTTFLGDLLVPPCASVCWTTTQLQIRDWFQKTPGVIWYGLWQWCLMKDALFARADSRCLTKCCKCPDSFPWLWHELGFQSESTRYTWSLYSQGSLMRLQSQHYLRNTWSRPLPHMTYCTDYTVGPPL